MEEHLLRMKVLLANFSLVGLFLQAPLTIFIVSKKLWRSFPIFTAYALSNLVATSCLQLMMIAHASPRLNFEAYWIFEGVAVLLGLGVVYEVFKNLVGSYFALQNLARTTFQVAVAGLALLGCIVIYTHWQGDRSPLAGGVLVIEEATRVVEVGLLMFLFLFSKAFGLHWRQNVFGIAVGLGLFTAVELAGVTIHAYFGLEARMIFTWARVLAFDASLLIWLGYLLVPERSTSFTEIPKRAQLEQWNQAIMELINQ